MIGLLILMKCIPGNVDLSRPQNSMFDLFYDGIGTMYYLKKKPVFLIK